MQPTVLSGLLFIFIYFSSQVLCVDIIIVSVVLLLVLWHCWFDVFNGAPGMYNPQCFAVL